MLDGAASTAGVDYSGTTSDTPGVVTPITFSATSRVIYIKNTDATNALLVSWDDQVTWFPLAATLSVSFDIECAGIAVKSASASVAYLCLVGC